MKILLVNDYAISTGGAELMMLSLRNGLRARGHDVRIFASSARPNNAESFADDTCFGTLSPFRTLLQTANLHAYFKLRKVLKDFKPDVVQVGVFLTQLSPLILPLLKNIPNVYKVHWYRPICPVGTRALPNGTVCHLPVGTACYRQGCVPLHDWLPLMAQMRLWQGWKHIFNILAPDGDALGQRLKQEGFGPVETVWPGVAVRPQRPPLSNPPTIGIAARLVHQKGVDILIRAFAQVTKQLPDTRLLIAGEGPDHSQLSALASELGLANNIQWLGQLSRPQIEKAFEPCWVQVVPSRYSEGFGIASAEAMMRGTAVVASNIPGLTERIEDGRFGFLVPQNDPHALAQALLKVLQDRTLAEAMGVAGREVALARYSEDNYVETSLRLYERVHGLHAPKHF